MALSPSSHGVGGRRRKNCRFPKTEFVQELAFDAVPDMTSVQGPAGLIADCNQPSPVQETTTRLHAASADLMLSEAPATGFTVMIMSSEDWQGPLVIAQRNTLVPTLKPVTPELGLFGSVTVPLPLTKVQVPVPTVGELPAKVAVEAGA